eukprot:COSAG02_NODE_10070_length_2033_cov_6.874354_1_plen_137_part_00
MLLVKYDKSYEKAVDWTAAAVKKISFNSAAADSDIVHFFTDFEEVMATRAPYTMYEEMLSRLSEQAVASSVREYTKQEVADMAVDDIIAQRKKRIQSYAVRRLHPFERLQVDNDVDEVTKNLEGGCNGIRYTVRYI